MRKGGLLCEYASAVTFLETAQHAHASTERGDPGGPHMHVRRPHGRESTTACYASCICIWGKHRLGSLQAYACGSGEENCLRSLWLLVPLQRPAAKRLQLSSGCFQDLSRWIIIYSQTSSSLIHQRVNQPSALSVRIQPSCRWLGIHLQQRQPGPQCCARGWSCIRSKRAV